MKRFERPTSDFWLTDLSAELDVVETHTRAGFDPIPPEVVRLRLFILFDFLQSKGLLTAPLAISPDQVTPTLALRNHHLTEEGYYFLQKYLMRWQDRLYKHTNDLKERAFLEKWYAAFKQRAAEQ